jgi:hypothetical protein
MTAVFAKKAQVRPISGILVVVVKSFPEMLHPIAA